MPVAARTPLRRTRLRAQARREHLLDVAGAMLMTEGFDALTMEGLALRAGVSKGLGYAYFDNADDLALALHAREVEAVFRRVEEAMATAAAFEDKMARALGAYFDLVAERGALFALLEGRLSRRRRTRSQRDRLGAFVAFWSAALQQAFAVTPARASALAGVVLSTADLFARAWGAGRLSRPDAERLCRDFVLGGLKGATARPFVAAPRATRRRSP